jgi:hypothetical protein
VDPLSIKSESKPGIWMLSDRIYAISSTVVATSG